MEGDSNSSGVSQILVEIGKMGRDLAVITEQLKAVPDHESRIRVVERAQARIMGAAAAIGVISGSGGTLVTYLLTHRR